jgi:hypothetical protein
MEGNVSGQVDFTLNGRRVSLSAEQVRLRVQETPEPVRQHGVRVDGVVFPVKQVFELATGVPRSEFTSQTARRHLAALGFEIVGDVESRDRPAVRVAPSVVSASAPPAADRGVDEEWHTEARVQSSIVRSLVADGWEIVSVADTAAREHGVDVLARRGGEQLAIEVKGFPSRNYADPARAGETKRTQPSTQAKHWYAQAVLTAMLTRSRRPQHRSVVALPDFPRYRELYRETMGSLHLTGVEVWWVHRSGTVEAGQ